MNSNDLGKLARAVGTLITTTAVLIYNHFANKKS